MQAIATPLNPKLNLSLRSNRPKICVAIATSCFDVILILSNRRVLHTTIIDTFQCHYFIHILKLFFFYFGVSKIPAVKEFLGWKRKLLTEIIARGSHHYRYATIVKNVFLILSFV